MAYEYGLLSRYFPFPGSLARIDPFAYSSHCNQELCRPRNFDDIVSGLLEQARAGLHRSTVAAFLSERYTERNAVFVWSQSRARDWLQCRRHRVSAFTYFKPHTRQLIKALSSAAMRCAKSLQLATASCTLLLVV